MKVEYISNINNFKEEGCVMSLGYFDGIHLGHRRILEEAVKIAKREGLESSVITFNESVREYLRGESPKYLTCLDTKLDIIKKIGFDTVHVVELTDEFVNLTKDEFISLFLKGSKFIVVGFDYTFGKNALGNTDYLKETLGDKVIVIDKQQLMGEKIGTSKIVSYLKEGNMESVYDSLGRSYVMEGTISKKNKSYSFLTLNYQIKSGKYKIRISSRNEEIVINAKLKSHPENNEIIIKPLDDTVVIEMERHKRFKVEVIEPITMENPEKRD